MPTLEWIGKGKVVNHHREVPFRVLEQQYMVFQNKDLHLDGAYRFDEFLKILKEL